jgi:hypothetical protein
MVITKQEIFLFVIALSFVLFLLFGDNWVS